LLDRVFFLLLLLPTSSTRLLIWLEWSRDLFSDMFWNLNVDIKNIKKKYHFNFFIHHIK
jgi:hypothetical protein